MLGLRVAPDLCRLGPRLTSAHWQCALCYAALMAQLLALLRGSEKSEPQLCGAHSALRMRLSWTLAQALVAGHDKCTNALARIPSSRNAQNSSTRHVVGHFAFDASASCVCASAVQTTQPTHSTSGFTCRARHPARDALLDDQLMPLQQRLCVAQLQCLTRAGLRCRQRWSPNKIEKLQFKCLGLPQMHRKCRGAPALRHDRQRRCRALGCGTPPARRV